MTLNADQLKTVAKKLIDDEIGRTLILQKAKTIGVSVTPEMVTAKLNNVKKTFKSDAVFEHKLADNGMSLEQYQEELRTDLIMDQVIKKEVESKINLSKKDLKDYYDKNIGQYRTPEKVRASVILIKLPPDSSSEKEKQARKKNAIDFRTGQSGNRFFRTGEKILTRQPGFQRRRFGVLCKKPDAFGFQRTGFSIKCGEGERNFQDATRVSPS